MKTLSAKMLDELPAEIRELRIPVFFGYFGDDHNEIMAAIEAAKTWQAIGYDEWYYPHWTERPSMERIIYAERIAGRCPGGC